MRRYVMGQPWRLQMLQAAPRERYAAAKLLMQHVLYVHAMYFEYILQQPRGRCMQLRGLVQSHYAGIVCRSQKVLACWQALEGSAYVISCRILLHPLSEANCVGVCIHLPSGLHVWRYAW